MPHELNADQKNHFEVSTSLISHNNELFLNQIVMCYEKWIFYDNQWQPAQWLNQKEAPKQFLKPNFHQKKVMINVCWSAATLVYCSFLYQVKPLGLRSMLSKLMRCTTNWKACSQHWSKGRAQFFSMTTPDSMSRKQHVKSWRIGLQSLASSAIFT